MRISINRIKKRFSMRTFLLSLTLVALTFIVGSPAIASATATAPVTTSCEYECFVMGPVGNCGSFWACVNTYEELMTLFDIVDAMC